MFNYIQSKPQEYEGLDYIFQLVKNLTSYTYAEHIRAKISDEKTYDIQYYQPHFVNKEDHGTTHINVLGPDGSAVSITTTLNHG